MNSTAVASGVRSTLNPNAPLFIPAAIQQVEDFSPQWWELVKTTTWFRDHWFHQHQEQESFDGDDEEDVASFLPDSVDLDMAEELSSQEAEFYGEPYFSPETASAVELCNHLQFLLEEEASLAAAVAAGLGLKSPRNGSPKPIAELAKYRERPVKCMNPKLSPRRIIQQPR